MVSSFLLSLLLFTAIGLLSSLRSTHSSEDYLLAGGNVKPWLAGLSAIATNNSGFMFIGMIGYTYTQGIRACWLIIGWILGDLIAAYFVYRKILAVRTSTNSLSFSELLGRIHGHNFKLVRTVSALLTVVFLGMYSSAQLKAGSKALHVLLQWDQSTGAIVGALIVLLYCFAGGIRASIWTDAAQSFVMLVSMIAIPIVAVEYLGGIDHFIQQLTEVSPTYISFSPLEAHNASGFLISIFLAGWLFGGTAVAGQPHVMIRFMTLKSSTGLKECLAYYYLWYVLFCICTFLAGLTTRIIISDTRAFDPELALPTVALQLLPPGMVGLILAGIFAATMSTADSQILSCSAAISRDIFSNSRMSYWKTKLATILITAGSLSIALTANESVFSLVMIAWSGLGASFVPVLLTAGCGFRITSEIAVVVGMLTGFSTVVVWRLCDLNHITYEVFPGIVLGFLALITYEFTWRKRTSL